MMLSQKRNLNEHTNVVLPLLHKSISTSSLFFFSFCEEMEIQIGQECIQVRSEKYRVIAESWLCHFCPPPQRVYANNHDAGRSLCRAQIIAASSTLQDRKNKQVILLSLKMVPTLGTRTFYTAGGASEVLGRESLDLGRWQQSFF